MSTGPSSVHRALRILTELADGPLSISELGRRLDVHRTTSLRLLRALEEDRFVRRTPEGHYRLGPRMATIAHAASAGMDLTELAAPHLRKLGVSCGHTVHLGALDGAQVVYLDKVDSRQAVRMYSHVGAQVPAHATAMGKVLLAGLPRADRDTVLGTPPFARCTTNTRTTREELDQDLRLITGQGWGLDDQEHEELIHCVAAPIRDAGGRTVAAVSVSVPIMLLDQDGLLRLVPALTDSASAISEELGWRPS